MFGPVCRVLVVGLMVGMAAVAAPGPEPEPDPPPTATPVEGAGPCTVTVSQGVTISVQCDDWWEGTSWPYDVLQFLGRECQNGLCTNTIGGIATASIPVGQYTEGHQYVVMFDIIWSGTGTLMNCMGTVTDEGCCEGQWPYAIANTNIYETLCL